MNELNIFVHNHRTFTNLTDFSIFFIGLFFARNYVLVLLVISFLAFIESIYTLYQARKMLLESMNYYALDDDYNTLRLMLTIHFRGLIAKYYFALMTVVGLEMSGIGFLYGLANIFYEYVLTFAIIVLVVASMFLSMYIVADYCCDEIWKIFKLHIFIRKIKNII